MGLERGVHSVYGGLCISPASVEVVKGWGRGREAAGSGGGGDIRRKIMLTVPVNPFSSKISCLKKTKEKF